VRSLIAANRIMRRWRARTLANGGRAADVGGGDGLSQPKVSPTKSRKGRLIAALSLLSPRDAYHNIKGRLFRADSL
jgi:hypothetical protein